MQAMGSLAIATIAAGVVVEVAAESAEKDATVPQDSTIPILSKALSRQVPPLLHPVLPSPNLNLKRPLLILVAPLV